MKTELDQETTLTTPFGSPLGDTVFADPKASAGSTGIPPTHDYDRRGGL